MAKWMLMVALGAAAPVLGLAAPTPATAQVQNGTLVIYGNDRCPTNADGEEIVVCVRRGEEERFRIPKELREAVPDPENESWAARQQNVFDAAETGIGSCSTIGPGGQSGCLNRDINRARAERNARRAADANVPLP